MYLGPADNPHQDLVDDAEAALERSDFGAFQNSLNCLHDVGERDVALDLLDRARATPGYYMAGGLVPSLASA